MFGDTTPASRTRDREVCRPNRARSPDAIGIGPRTVPRLITYRWKIVYDAEDIETRSMLPVSPTSECPSDREPTEQRVPRRHASRPGAAAVGPWLVLERKASSTISDHA
ncbi:hypothetical protein C8039_13675 [Halogeometricum sp. wsp3]|nr:hypothetical protein C8039_13675 [Halogeometricum sp. wsp3]